jgi:hypothetical protein
MALTTSLSIRASAQLSKTIGTQTMSLTPLMAVGITLANGNGLNQADRVYYAKPDIAGSATLALDLAAGGLLDVFGDAFSIAKLKVVVIQSELALCPNPITFRVPATGPPGLGTGGMNIRPGGAFCWVAPDLAAVAVTPGTGDVVEFVNTAAGTVKPEILIIGAA